MTIKQEMEARLIELECTLRDTREAMVRVNLAWANMFNEPSSVNDQLTEENRSLRQALAYYYTPTDLEHRDWYDHCAVVDASGGRPPSEEIHWSNIAVAGLETEHRLWTCPRCSRDVTGPRCPCIFEDAPRGVADYE